MGGFTLKTVLIKSVYDRKTGKKIKEGVADYIEMEEDKYYSPIVKLIGNELLKDYKTGGDKCKLENLREEEFY